MFRTSATLSMFKNEACQLQTNIQTWRFLPKWSQIKSSLLVSYVQPTLDGCFSWCPTKTQQKWLQLKKWNLVRKSSFNIIVTREKDWGGRCRELKVLARDANPTSVILHRCQHWGSRLHNDEVIEDRNWKEREEFEANESMCPKIEKKVETDTTTDQGKENNDPHHIKHK